MLPLPLEGGGVVFTRQGRGLSWIEPVHGEPWERLFFSRGAALERVDAGEERVVVAAEVGVRLDEVRELARDVVGVRGPAPRRSALRDRVLPSMRIQLKC